MASEYPVGEPIEQAHWKRGRDHVILSEAKDLRATQDDMSASSLSQKGSPTVSALSMTRPRQGVS